MTRFAALVLIALATSSALAGPRENFIFSLSEHTGGDLRTEVIDKLVTFKLGKQCMAKLGDRTLNAVSYAAGIGGNIADYAKIVTGDDWNALDSQGRDEVKPILSEKIAAFRARFGMTIYVEGDDCDAGKRSLWLWYWDELSRVIKSYPPPSGKAFIVLDVTPRAKTVTCRVSKDGTTFTVTAPRDVEPEHWVESIDEPFRKLASGRAR
jgi:hypothetical protein